ncbi:MAG TPA: sugar phosphate nucleotidyltransferase [Gemmatimonadaceae bacterium]|nr:sugar phosphate nucleotidyltransferase [Gemmatimonadaceae bacterium]
MSVRRALIPCGGKGTRMLALSGGGPKELLRVGGVSALSRVARECAASGITELLVVIAPGKEAIVEHLAPRAGERDMPKRIAFVEQPEPRGLADAIRLGRAFAAGAALGVALPDNLFIGDRPALAQVIDRFVETGRNVVAVVEISADEAERRGPTSVLEGRLVGDAFEITRIPDKRERGDRFDTGGAASAFTGVGRYVLDADAFDAIDQVEQDLPQGAELDDVPVMQQLLLEGRLTGRRVRGRFLDLGIPDGFREADQLLASR